MKLLILVYAYICIYIVHFIVDRCTWITLIYFAYVQQYGERNLRVNVASRGRGRGKSRGTSRGGSSSGRGMCTNSMPILPL